VKTASTAAVEHVSVAYGDPGLRVQALAGVSLSFFPGTLTVITGPSGSGKTTLLSLLGCILTPDEGRVRIMGAETSSLTDAERTTLRRTHVGFVFQAFRLFRSLSAFENVMVSADIGPGRSRSQVDAARNLLSELGLADRMHLKPNQLSGGEKQRVAIARALLSDPSILLADEPTASLDSRASSQISEILARLAAEQRRTVIVVSHDHRWTHFAQRIIVLEHGRIAEDRSSLE
jgi:putative ABC transport system ATP-binding protein